MARRWILELLVHPKVWLNAVTNEKQNLCSLRLLGFRLISAGFTTSIERWDRDYWPNIHGGLIGAEEIPFSWFFWACKNGLLLKRWKSFFDSISLLVVDALGLGASVNGLPFSELAGFYRWEFIKTIKILTISCCFASIDFDVSSGDADFSTIETTKL